MFRFSIREVVLLAVIVALATGWGLDRFQANAAGNAASFDGLDLAMTVVAVGLGLAWFADRRRRFPVVAGGRMVQIAPGVYSDSEVDRQHWEALERLKKQNSN